ncbi:MAG: TolC family protein [Gemmatimonadaceae bacterium]|nr:TolC family protein [Gemmatimonadaceae bacterium]
MPSGLPLTNRVCLARAARIVLTLLSLSAGCAHYVSVPLSASRTLDDLEARRLDAPAVGEFLKAGRAVEAWPLSTWNLRQLSLAAFFYSPSLDVARAQWQSAQGGVITAGGRPNPTLSAGEGFDATTPATQISPWMPQVSLALPIEMAGKRGVRVDRARAQAEVAHFNVLTTAWQVRRAVREAYVELFAATAIDSLQSTRQSLAAEVVRILEAQRAVGDVAVFDVTQARLALADARIAALSAQQRHVEARSALAAAVGVSTVALDATRFTFDEFARPAPLVPDREVRRVALLQRADVRAALADYDVSQANLKLEIRNQYPDLTLGPGYQLDQTDVKWSLSLSLPVALLNRNQGPIAEARARREEMAARFLALQARVIVEVDRAVAASALTRLQVSVADSITTSLGRQQRSTEAGYRAGELSKLQLLGVQLELVSAALARIDVVSRAQLTVGALEDAMQSTFDLEPWIIATPNRGGATTLPAKDQPS